MQLLGIIYLYSDSLLHWTITYSIYAFILLLLISLFFIISFQSRLTFAFPSISSSILKITNTEKNRDHIIDHQVPSNEIHFKYSKQGFLKISLSGKIDICNPASVKILGFKDSPALKKINFLKNTHRHSQKQEYLLHLINTGTEFEFEENWKKPDGTSVIIRERYLPEKGVDEDVMYYCWIDDISTLHKAERDRNIITEKYESLINQVPVGIYRVAHTGEVLFANDHLAKMLGVDKAQDLIGTSFNNYQYGKNIFTDVFKKTVFGDKNTLQLEYTLINKDKDIIWVQDTASITYDTSGEVLFYDGIVEDITARKKAQEELNRLITAITQISEGIIITDTSGIILYANPAVEVMSQFTFDELKGKNIIEFKSEYNSKEFYNKLLSTISGGKTWSGKIINRKKNGELFEEYMVVSPVFNHDGNIINYVAVKRDITEEKKLEEKLRQSQKLQAIGTLAGGIAHDFNNILMGMQIYTEILLKKLDKTAPEHGLLDKVYGAQNRAKDLIKQILSFSRQTSDEREPLQIHIICKEALKLIKSTFPATLKVETNIHDCGYVLANPTQIHQIVMNLCTNANHAMEGQGKLTFSLIRTNEVAYSNGNIKKDDKPWVKLTVKDTGCGIEPKIKDRIFEPFFTTKAVGHGTGLGLSTIHGIVRQYGGEINFKSEIGIGTEFYIYLPAL